MLTQLQTKSAFEAEGRSGTLKVYGLLSGHPPIQDAITACVCFHRSAVSRTELKGEEAHAFMRSYEIET